MANKPKQVGVATPADIRRALHSRSIPFIQEVAWRVGYHDGDGHPAYAKLHDRAARLRNAVTDVSDTIAQIQANGIQPDQECEVVNDGE